MTTNTNSDATPESVMAEITELVEQKFGSTEGFDLDEIADAMLLYHIFHQLLQKPGLQLVLTKLLERVTDAREMSKNLSALHAQVESLYAIHMMVLEDNPADFEELATLIFLTKTEQDLILRLAQLYAQALQRVDDPASVDVVEVDEKVLLALSRDEMLAYLDLLSFHAAAQQEREDPLEVLFDFEKFAIDDLDEIDKNINFTVSMMRLEFLRNEEDYQAIIRQFEVLHQPFLRDLAHLLLFYTHIMQNISTSTEYVEKEIQTIQGVLVRLASYQAGEWDIFEEFEEFQNLFNVFIGSLHMTLGRLAFVPVSERMNHLAKAEQYFATSNILNLRTNCPALRWERAQLLPTRSEREQMEAEAFQLLYDLLTESVLAEQPVERAMNMAQLLLLPAQWKMNKGRFLEAIEDIGIARSLAQAVIRLVDNEKAPSLEEFEKYLADPDISPEERQQTEAARDNYLRFSEASRFWSYQCELLTYTCQAQLAESEGRFADASVKYEETARLQKKTLKLATDLMEILTRVDADATGQFGSTASPYRIRAIYFQGMVSLNRGDHALMERKYKEARDHYQDARAHFQRSVMQWAATLGQLSPSQTERVQAIKEKELGQDRARYCDAKVALVEAQQFSAHDDFLRAATAYNTAAGIFAEVWHASRERETERNLTMLQASEKYCRGCAFFELARHDKQEKMLPEARQFVNEAASLFKKAHEALWAEYIKALRFEYEADLYRRLAYASAPPHSTTYFEMAQKMVREAIEIFQQLANFQQLDIAERVQNLENFERALVDDRAASHVITILSVPKPADNLRVVQVVSGQLLNMEEMKAGSMQARQIEIEDRLSRLQAKVVSLQSGLEQWQTLLNKGRIDQGRFILFADEQRKELSETFGEARRVLEGRDERLDAIMLEAGSLLGKADAEEQERELLRKLAQLAQQRALPVAFVESLYSQQDNFLYWLIEVGKRFVDLTPVVL